MAKYTVQDVQQYIQEYGQLPTWRAGQDRPPDYFDEATRGIRLANPADSGGLPVRSDGTVGYDDYTHALGPRGNGMLPFLLASAGLAGVVGPAILGAGGGFGGEAAGTGAFDAGIFNPSDMGLGGGTVGAEAGTGAFDIGGSAGTMPTGTGTYGVTGGYTPPGGIPTGGNALTRLLGLDPKSSDVLDVLGKGGSTFLGLLGSNAQGDAYQNVANQFMQLGAGDRARLEASYQPGFDVFKTPGYDNLLGSITNSQLRGLSTHGNPYGDPGALATMNKNILSSVGVPALANYRGQLLQGGGTGLSSAAQGALMQAGTAKSPYDVLSAGIGSLTAPKNDYDELLDALKRYNGSQQFKLGAGYTGSPA